MGWLSNFRIKRSARTRRRRDDTDDYLEPLNQLHTRIVADREATLRLTAEMRSYNRNYLGDKPGFGDCPCDRCVLINHHIADWIDQELTTFLDDLGLDPYVPAEAWAVGELGHGPGHIALELVGIGRATKAHASSLRWGVSLTPGNTTPFPTLTEVFPWTREETLYSLCCLISVDSELNPAT